MHKTILHVRYQLFFDGVQCSVVSHSGLVGPTVCTSLTWNSVQDLCVFDSNQGSQPLPVVGRCSIHIVIDDAAGNIIVDKNIFSGRVKQERTMDEWE